MTSFIYLILIEEETVKIFFKLRNFPITEVLLKVNLKKYIAFDDIQMVLRFESKFDKVPKCTLDD